MSELNVYLERNGRLIQTGTITGNNSTDAVFRYSTEYLKDPLAVAISFSLDLGEEAFSPEKTRTYFEGLLPEGFTRRSVAQWMHVDENDYISILHGLGKECLGAICILERDEITEASYKRILKKQVMELAAEGATKSAEIVTKSHLSLTGASGKVGLYYDNKNDKWFLPQGTAPSTHIVKQSHIRLDGVVTNEQLSLSTAKKCGIPVPDSFIINTGRGKDPEILFATTRYDRVISGNKKINGLPRPLRLHQEDFAQAMGISSSAKYEHGHAGYMRDMFKILRMYSSDPIKDQIILWDIIIFNYLIGNTDAHIKNFSLLRGTDLKSIRLAPAYDIISTTVYEESTRDMSFSIGERYSIDEIDEDCIRKAAIEAGIGESIAMKRYERMCELFIPALTESARELTATGYPKVKEMTERIFKSGGIRNVKGGRL